MTFNIEISDAPDIQMLAAIHKECFTTAWDIRAIRELLGVAGTGAFFAPDKAFGLLRVLGEEAEILTLCVRPQYRGQGMARAIIKAMIAYSQQQKVEKLFLEVREGNAAAIMMYNNAGFELLSRRKEYYAMGSGRYEHALVLCRKI